MLHCHRLCIVGWFPTVTDIWFQCAEVAMHVAQNSGMLGERLSLNCVVGCRSVNDVASKSEMCSWARALTVRRSIP